MTEEGFYPAAMRRIYRILAVVSVAGVIGAILLRGVSHGVGFAIGAAASAISFRFMHRAVDALGMQEGKRPSMLAAWLFGFRYLVFGAIAYVIVKYFSISAVAVVTGLLVVVAAVLVEIIFELLYDRT